MSILYYLLVIAAISTMIIELPIEQVSLFFTLIQTYVSIISLEGELFMKNYDYIAVSGAHEVAGCVNRSEMLWNAALTSA